MPHSKAPFTKAMVSVMVVQKNLSVDLQKKIKIKKKIEFPQQDCNLGICVPLVKIREMESLDRKIEDDRAVVRLSHLLKVNSKLPHLCTSILLARLKGRQEGLQPALNIFGFHIREYGGLTIFTALPLQKGLEHPHIWYPRGLLESLPVDNVGQLYT